MTIKHLFPVAKPTFALNFAAERSLDPRVTFTRASIGTYVDANGVIQTAASDEPRFDHDPVTGKSLGLLVEEARTNLVADSASSNNWTVLTGGTAAASTSVCPDGSTTATRVTGAALNDGAYKSFTATASDIHLASYYARTRTGTDTIVKAAISGTTGLSVTLPADGSWVRVVGVPSNIGAGGKYLAVRSASAAIDIDVWGLQAELGAFPTSYIPTAGSAVARTVDVASITGTNFSSWYNQSEGTIYAELANMTTTGANAVWSFDNNTSSQRIMYRVNRGFVMTGYATISDNEDPVTAKFAYGIKANDYGGAKDGSILTAGTPGSVLPTVDRLNLGTGPGLPHSSGHIVRLSYYPRRLSNEQLQSLTA